MIKNVLARSLEEPDQVLPVPWAELAQRLHVEPGRLVLGLAAPGVGKSVFALNWALKLNEPCLYVSTDTDLRTQAKRAYTCLSYEADGGRRMIEEVEAANASWYLGKQKLLVRWADDVPGPLELAQLIEAEIEYHGRPPALTIVDVVDDLVSNESYEGYKEVFKILRRIARKYRTVIFCLHHVGRGDMAKGTVPVSLHAGTYTGEQTAEHVLGFWRPREQDPWGHDLFCIAVLKNRTGEAHPVPDYPDVRLQAKMEWAWIGDL